LKSQSLEWNATDLTEDQMAHVAGLDPLSFRLNSYWTFIGNVFHYGAQLGVLSLLAKLRPPEEVGQFSLGLAIVTPVLAAASLGLRQIQATDAEPDYSFGEYLTLRWITNLLSLVVIAGIVLAGPYRGETAWVIMAVASFRIVEAGCDVFHGLQQYHERMDRVAISMIASGLASLLAVGGVVSLTGDMLAGVIVMTIAGVAVLVFYDAPRAVMALTRPFERNPNVSQLRKFTTAVQRPDIRALARLALLGAPLSAAQVLIALNSSVPRLFIEHSLGEAQLGIFSAIAFPAYGGLLLVAAIGQAALPRLAKHYAALDYVEFTRLLLKLVAIAVGVGSLGVILAAAFGREVLSILYTPRYASHAHVLTWFMVSIGVGYLASVLGYAGIAVRAFNLVALVQILSTLATIWASVELIPVHGLYGGVAAIFLANSVQFFGSLLVVGVALRARSQGSR
jgi:O-antigen/teichoic acid export membrane protein